MSDTRFTAFVTKIASTWAQKLNDWAWKGRSPIHVTSTGTANAHVITLPTPSLYETLTSGDRFTYKAHAANTGALTLQVVGASSLSAKAVHLGGAVLVGGEIQIGDIVEVAYNGTVFQIVGGNPHSRFLQSGSATIATDVNKKLREIRSLFDYMTDAQRADVIAGTKGVDVTAAIQSAFDNLPSSGGCLYVPLGKYLVTSTLTITNKEGFLIYGAGEDSSRIEPSAALSGVPVLKVTNCRDYDIRDLGIAGNTGGKPEAAITFHRAASGGFAPTNMRCTNLLLGGTASDLLNGIQFTADFDSNNADGTFTNVKIREIVEAAYSIEHSDAVQHRIIGGLISSTVATSIGVKAAGGSFDMIGTGVNVRDVDFSISGTQLQPIHIIGVLSESVSAIIETTNTSSVNVEFTGYTKKSGTVSSTPIDFQSVNGRFSMVNCTLSIGLSGQTASFTDSGSVAKFIGCTLGITTFSWAGHLDLIGNYHNPGTVTLTQTGTLYQAGEKGGALVGGVRQNIGTSVGATGVSLLSGVLYSQAPATAKTTTGTTKETLFSYTLPANALNTTVDATTGGRMLRIRASGLKAANGNSITVGIDFGGTTVATLTTTGSGVPVDVEAVVFSRSSTTQRAIGRGETTGVAATVTRSTPTETLTGAVAITAFGTTGTTPGDVSLDSFSVEAL